MDAPIVPATHGHGYYDEHPTSEGGHRIVGGGVGVADVEEAHHHEKKPVLKKVKDKVKKIKDTISKKRHGDDGHDEHDVHYDDDEYGYDDEDEEMEVDPEVHGAPMYESTIAGNVVGGHDYYPGKERVLLESTGNVVGGHEYYPGKERMLESTGNIIGGQEYYPPDTLGNIKGDLEQDPAAPLPVSDPFTAGDMAQRPTISSAGGNELGVSPDVLRSLEAMAISGDAVESSPQTGTDDQFAPQDKTPRTGAEAADNKPSYTEQLSSTASAVKDAAVSAASTVYGKVAGAGTPTDHAEEEAVEKTPSYTEKISSTASAAKDAAVSAVYGTPTETQDQSTKPEKTRYAVEEEATEKKKPSYTEKLSSTASAAKDAALSAASTVYGKVAGSGTPTETQDQSTKTRVAAEEEAKKPSYTEKLSSTASAAKDAAVSAASTVYHKVAMVGGTPTGTHTPPEKTRTVAREETDKKPGYTGMLSSTAAAAKDAAVSTASTVYDKVAGAGTAMIGKGQPGGTGAMEGGERKAAAADKGVLVREFLSEKFRPGEEDRALCEVISETMQKKGEGEEVVVVERESVVAPPGGGKGMAEKIKGAVSSLLGGGGTPTSGAGGGERAHQGTGSMETPTR